MHERISLLTRDGKTIVLVDVSDCSAREVEKIAREVPEHVTVRPRGSVLLLTDFTGATIDQEALIAIKETAVFDKPYIKKTAWVGAEHFPRVFFENLREFSRREFPSFKTREDALTWLAKD
jgi:hypothetical protein